MAGVLGTRRWSRRETIALFGGAAASLALRGLASAATPEQLGRMPLGTNLGGLVDWSPEFAFANLFKQSRRWFSGTATSWQDGRALDIDKHGWVRSLQPDQWARTTMCSHTSMRGRYPTGPYVVTYAGEGTLAYMPNVRVLERAPGREVIEVDNTRGGFGVYLTSTNPANYLRDLVVRLPGDYPDGVLFYPPFVETIKNYRVLRFVNWILGQNNNSIVQERWSDRPTVHDAQWSYRGAPVEVMTALCNRIGAHGWFNVPHMADDDYVHNFALRMRDTLDPRLRVYVEHSNETWNFVFPAARYCQERGLALGLSADAFQAQVRYHARRSKEVFRIFAAVFPPERLVRVLASQAGGPWISQQMLSFEDTRAHVDALAIAPYFGVRLPNYPRIVGMNLDHLFAELESVSLPEARMTMVWQRDIARQHNLPLISYEGGQHLTTIGPYERDDATNELFFAANRDRRMGALYDRYLRDWNEVSGQSLFMHLGNCAASDRGGLGSFGSLEYLTQPRAEAPKYDALQRWIEGR